MQLILLKIDDVISKFLEKNYGKCVDDATFVFFWTCLDDATVFCVNYGLFPDSQVFFVKCAKCKYLIIDQTTNKSIHYTKPIACIQDVSEYFTPKQYTLWIINLS